MSEDQNRSIQDMINEHFNLAADALMSGAQETVDRAQAALEQAQTYQKEVSARADKIRKTGQSWAQHNAECLTRIDEVIAQVATVSGEPKRTTGNGSDHEPLPRVAMLGPRVQADAPNS